MLLAHISDLHLDGSERATRRATRVMDHLRALPHPPDALLVTGDIADHGEEAEYEEAARILSAPFPVLTCPGNHDARPAYRKALLGQEPDDGPINQAHHVDGTAILMCDSTIPGSDQGLLDTGTLAWIDTELTALPQDTPALIAFHQPPVALHHPLPDSYMLEEPERLADLLAAHPQVAAVLTGHAHTAAASTFAARPLIVGPAVTWTLRLPWEGDQAADRDQPPGLAFHILDDTRRLTTHYRVVI
ncbi:3',5'-cyclic adenosine monophosphate phosphodiesterase CpdA [Streptomyces ambofaciens ATCC 23877]|uniref:3',5'-cyclic adenosine monophosphate phosphodiesterase CpdA n=1 Tax=Streptomyces ambofaciens (strain ATCC 23877 / 3486 / DSM 40053 / JCM 4204 / NBRC 12836 / NRRL B-2516) TaxID=278992 RepID=A3KI13_STRA7|nr:metallophosphoesterase [Streptomyces ambofaciens]AKZ53452.1 3',5'-cyclic adenosine monophosphate phosphodiesterase CpdA [Streptomyces ambofaciens ATCC 23877]CAJ89340.1 putative phosphodiesterase [Streptomyces ambofaciens ATCC 23877]